MAWAGEGKLVIKLEGLTFAHSWFVFNKVHRFVSADLIFLELNV